MTAPATGGWLANAITTVVLWGIWGAFTGLSPEHGFPETLVYCVWAIMMIPPALIVLRQDGWRLDRTPAAIAYGMGVGLLGAGGQMVLFYAVTRGPAYLIFPIISLSPVVTIALSFLLLRERTGRLGALGILLALLALPMFDLSFQGAGPGAGLGWFVLALIVMLCWGIQALLMKMANRLMSAGSIFFYMMLSGLLLTPAAWVMTDLSRPINLGFDGPVLAAAIQLLNAIGALTLVRAFRHGKAIIVAPLTNAGAPLVTAVIALIVAGILPGSLKLVGLALAFAASILLAIEPSEEESAQPARV